MDRTATAASELPKLRFIDNLLVYYPRLELVVETELSFGRDPYLADHRVDSKATLPRVIGLKAMAQVASALAVDLDASTIEAVAFNRAIVVPDGGVTRIRIMALAGEDGRVEVVLRASDDDFATNCLQATFVDRAFPKSEVTDPMRGFGNVDAAPACRSFHDPR